MKITALLVAGLLGVAHANRDPLKAQKETDRKVFFEIGIGGVSVGRLEFVLFDSFAPKTTENFYQLVKGDGTYIEGGETKPLKYEGSNFHRILPKFMAQGGDFTKGNGTGGRSIYGEKFADENFLLDHTSKGLLSMANAGANTNGSQFFITFTATPWLDKKHVVFGRILDLSENSPSLGILQKMEAVGSDGSGKPSKQVTILKAGVLGEKAPPAA